MNELCPVCNAEYTQNVTKCELCGFADENGINRKWTIAEDAEDWRNTVVKPYRMEWHKQIKTLQKWDMRLQKNQTPDELGEKRKEIAVFQRYISAGNSHIVGLRSDGTVVTVGNNQQGQCDTAGWLDIGRPVKKI